MRPLLIINPPSDEAFARVCHEALDLGSTSSTAFQVALRLQYPDAVVRPRELSGETIIVWYVYRDGHWVSSS